MINHGSFFKGKDPLQLDRFQFLIINSLITETIKNYVSKQNFYKQIAKFDNNDQNRTVFKHLVRSGMKKKTLENKIC